MPRPPLAIFLCFVGASAFAGSCTDTPGREPGDVVDNRGGDAAADARAPLDASTEGGEDAAAPLLTVLATADGFTIDNGLLSVHYDTRTGFTDYPAGGAAAPFIHDAYASVDLGTGGAAT